MKKGFDEKITEIRNFLFVDKARSEREYQIIKLVVDRILYCTGGHLTDKEIFAFHADTRYLYYDTLSCLGIKVLKLYNENKSLKKRVKELETINNALLENPNAIIIKSSKIDYGRELRVLTRGDHL